MLTLKDVIYAKNDKKKVIFHAPFSRIYLEFGPTDKTETKESKVVSVEDDGTEKIYKTEILVPATAVSVEDPDVLFATAVETIQAKFPTINPVWKILEYASNGFNLEMRKDAAPKRDVAKKPLTLDAGIKKMAETLLRTGKVATMDEAVAMVTAMLT